MVGISHVNGWRMALGVGAGKAAAASRCSRWVGDIGGSMSDSEVIESQLIKSPAVLMVSGEGVWGSDSPSTEVVLVAWGRRLWVPGASCLVIVS